MDGVSSCKAVARSDTTPHHTTSTGCAARGPGPRRGRAMPGRWARGAGLQRLSPSTGRARRPFRNQSRGLMPHHAGRAAHAQPEIQPCGPTPLQAPGRPAATEHLSSQACSAQAPLSLACPKPRPRQRWSQPQPQPCTSQCGAPLGPRARLGRHPPLLRRPAPGPPRSRAADPGRARPAAPPPSCAPPRGRDG